MLANSRRASGVVGILPEMRKMAILEHCHLNELPMHVQVEESRRPTLEDHNWEAGGQHERQQSYEARSPGWNILAPRSQLKPPNCRRYLQRTFFVGGDASRRACVLTWTEGLRKIHLSNRIFGGRMNGPLERNAPKPDQGRVTRFLLSCSPSSTEG